MARLAGKLVLLALAALTAAGGAHAERLPEPSCSLWLERAQELEADGRLVEVRELLGPCTSRICGERERELCRQAERRLRGRTPRLLVRVRDTEGGELPRARLFVDGRFAAIGTPLDLDPGAHLVRTEEDGHVGRLQRIRLTEGERLVLPVELRPRREPGDERLKLLGDRLEALRDERWPMPEAAWTMAAIGVASLAGAMLLDAQAGDGLEGMRSCAPDCETAVVDAVERDIQLSRLAGGMSVLSLATAAWLALAETPADAFAPRSSGAPRLRVFGGPGGMRVNLITSFDETQLFGGGNPLGRPPERLPPPPRPAEFPCSFGCLSPGSPFGF